MIHFITQDYTSLGLAIDVIGAALIFFFGVPNKPFFLRSEQVIVVDEGKSKVKEKIFSMVYKSLSYLGIFLLIVGFLLQIIDRYCAYN